MKEIKLARAKNDRNGNPRVIVHYIKFLTKLECERLSVLDGYEVAYRRAKHLGFSVYKGKDFGGGFVTQCFNEHDLKVLISDTVETIEFAHLATAGLPYRKRGRWYLPFIDVNTGVTSLVHFKTKNEMEERSITRLNQLYVAEE